MTHPSRATPPTPPGPVTLVGAELLVASSFAALSGKRVGLVTNQTGLAHGRHLADLLHDAPNVRLAAILAPEHGFRGTVEAGAKVRDGVDPRTRAPVHSLYGATRRPTPAMLAGLDVLVFDIQDIGARFYTYISTMGLAMQAAARARLPFVVLDRPNPLGGTYVSGFVCEPGLTSFVGQYPIPIVHGMTVGELAGMIKAEGWLDGLSGLDLSVIKCQGWSRDARWPATQRAWVPTSPNIPSFEAALVYPGIGIVGETEVNEGRGTPTPFSLVGAPWLDAPRMVTRLAKAGLPGIDFEAVSYTPRSIPNVALRPRFVGQAVTGVRVVVRDVARYTPLEVGMHVLAAVAAEARAKGVAPLISNLAMFHKIAGTKRLHRFVDGGSDGHAMIEAWQGEVRRFSELRSRHLLY
ncbi:MAG: DUF1343 domain-containing protein [Hyphomicrobiaceae bacterium]|nr:DUF1343 domain-containing protein [Hyphomicrobiaceae bacterium]